MKRTKKLLAGIIAATMMLSMSTTAFADSPQPGGGDSITITKEYNAVNEGTKAPAETFQFAVENVSVTDAAAGITAENMPKLTVGNAFFNEEVTDIGTADIKVTLPEYGSVGIYTYKITETASNTAGVTYDSSPVYVKVTVTRGEDGNLVYSTAVRKGEEDAAEKVGDGDDNTAFTNTYSAGSLSITKKISGNLADEDKYFDVTVRLTGDGSSEYADAYTVTGGSYEENPTTIAVGTPAAFKVKANDTIKIENLPYGVTYTVEEADYTGENGGYEPAQYTFNDENKTIDSEADTVTITNAKAAGEIDTGINMDSMPYILIFAGVVVIAAVMIVRRRRIDD